MGRWEYAFKASAQKARDTVSSQQWIIAGHSSYNGRLAGGQGVIGAEVPWALRKIHRYLDDIWANIYLESHERPSILMLCGSVPGEGCTFISFHLALFLALEQNLKVLYVDTDTGGYGSGPIIPGIQNMPGLASFFTSQQILPSLTLRSEYENLFVLPSGFQTIAERTHKNGLFKKEAVESFFSYCRGNFDVTIIDGQPIAFNPLMIGLARPLGKMALVCRYGYSRREVTKIAVDKLAKNNISVIGVILNKREYPIPSWVYQILK